MLHLEWWATSASKPGKTRFSPLLVPTLWIVALVGILNDNDVRELFRPTAEVVFVVGLGIQAQETVVFGIDAIGRLTWIVSVLAHASVVPLYTIGVPVTDAGVLIAIGIYSLYLIVAAVVQGPNDWPYGLSPFVCFTFVSCVLIVRL